jgi:hypothetical protein
MNFISHDDASCDRDCGSLVRWHFRPRDPTLDGNVNRGFVAVVGFGECDNRSVRHRVAPAVAHRVCFERKGLA